MKDTRMKKPIAFTLCALLVAGQFYAQNPPCPSQAIEIIDLES